MEHNTLDLASSDRMKSEAGSSKLEVDDDDDESQRKSFGFEPKKSYFV